MENGLQVHAPAQRGHDDGLRAWAQQHRAEAIAVPRREEADGRRRVQDEVALRIGGAEVEAGGLVDEQPRLELAIGDGVAHVRRLHPR